MKKVLLTIGTLGCLASFVVAGPNWNRVNYTRSTIFTGIVTFDDEPATEGDVVGIFVGTECRMVSTVFSKDGVSYVSAVLHGDVAEKAVMKVWHQETGLAYEADATVTSDPDGELQLVPIRVKSGTNTTNLSRLDNDININHQIGSSDVTVTADKAIKSIQVINSIGKGMKTEKLNEKNAVISVDGLSRGIYFVAVTLEDGTTLTKKIMKD